MTACQPSADALATYALTAYQSATYELWASRVP